MAQSHFLSLKDWSREEIELLFEESAAIKANPEGYATALAGQDARHDLREVVDAHARVVRGRHVPARRPRALPVGRDIQLGRGETIADTAQVLSRYVDGIMARTFAHRTVTRPRRARLRCPVINGLTDLLHPCQGARRLLHACASTSADLKGLKLAYVGDGNNVAHSLMFGGAKVGHARSRSPAPTGYEPNPVVVKLREGASARRRARRCRGHQRSAEAVAGADVVYTDVWTSMGQEAEQEKRARGLRRASRSTRS